MIFLIVYVAIFVGAFFVVSYLQRGQEAKGFNSLKTVTFGDETALAATVRARRPELSVVAPLQSPGSDAPNAILQWQPAYEPNAKKLVSSDRVALRRLMLGLLALRPAGSQP